METRHTTLGPMAHQRQATYYAKQSATLQSLDALRTLVLHHRTLFFY